METAKMIIVAVARWLFILCLPVLLLTVSIALAVNSQWLYEHGFNKCDVHQTTGLADSELKKAASGLISYFNLIEQWRREYNPVRPHSALGYRPPVPEAILITT
jgi:hypothetical protein